MDTHHLADQGESYTVHFQDIANTIPSAPLNSFTYPVAGGGTVTNPNITFADGTTVGTNVNVPQETLIRKYQFSRQLHAGRTARTTMKFGANWIYFAKMGGYLLLGPRLLHHVLGQSHLHSKLTPAPGPTIL